MIRELRTGPLLDGYRGRPKADVDALAAALVAFSRMALQLGDATLAFSFLSLPAFLVRSQHDSSAIDVDITEPKVIDHLVYVHGRRLNLGKGGPLRRRTAVLHALTQSRPRHLRLPVLKFLDTANGVCESHSMSIPDVELRSYQTPLPRRPRGPTMRSVDVTALNPMPTPMHTSPRSWSLPPWNTSFNNAPAPSAAAA